MYGIFNVSSLKPQKYCALINKRNYKKKIFDILGIFPTVATIGLIASLSSKVTYASSLDFIKHGRPVVQLGGFLGSQGKAQTISIAGLIGDDYTLSKHNDGNVLVGLGYYLDGPERKLFNLSYGINAFYLANTTVKGNVVQEFMFTNLAYHYSISHVPLFVDAKATLNAFSQEKYDITLDAGIGPNFMMISKVSERPTTGSNALPDRFFSDNTSTTFAATLGVGVRLKNALRHTPLECGYRFYYLGEGALNRETSQLRNTLKTGQVYANALLCAVKF